MPPHRVVNGRRDSVASADGPDQGPIRAGAAGGEETEAEEVAEAPWSPPARQLRAGDVLEVLQERSVLSGASVPSREASFQGRECHRGHGLLFQVKRHEGGPGPSSWMPAWMPAPPRASTPSLRASAFPRRVCSNVAFQMKR